MNCILTDGKCVLHEPLNERVMIQTSSDNYILSAYSPARLLVSLYLIYWQLWTNQNVCNIFHLSFWRLRRWRKCYMPRSLGYTCTGLHHSIDKIGNVCHVKALLGEQSWTENWVEFSYYPINLCYLSTHYLCIIGGKRVAWKQVLTLKAFKLCPPGSFNENP